MRTAVILLWAGCLWSIAGALCRLIWTASLWRKLLALAPPSTRRPENGRLASALIAAATSHT